MKINDQKKPLVVVHCVAISWMEVLSVCIFVRSNEYIAFETEMNQQAVNSDHNPQHKSVYIYINMFCPYETLMWCISFLWHSYNCALQWFIPFQYCRFCVRVSDSGMNVTLSHKNVLSILVIFSVTRRLYFFSFNCWMCHNFDGTISQSHCIVYNLLSFCNSTKLIHRLRRREHALERRTVWMPYTLS